MSRKTNKSGRPVVNGGQNKPFPSTRPGRKSGQDKAVAGPVKK